MRGHSFDLVSSISPSIRNMLGYSIGVYCRANNMDVENMFFSYIGCSLRFVCCLHCWGSTARVIPKTENVNADPLLTAGIRDTRLKVNV